MTEKQYVSTTEASEMLISAGIIRKNTRYPTQATKRLVNLGLIRGTPPPKNQPRLGYQIDVSSIDEYITIGNLNNSDLIKLVLDLKAENEAIKSNKKNTKAQPKSVKKQPTKKTVEVLTLRETLEFLESKTAVDLATELGRGKNYISDRLNSIGFVSKRSNVAGETQTVWIWDRDDKKPPLNANVLEQRFVSNNK